MKLSPRRTRWVARFGAGAIKALGATWRVRRTGFDVQTLVPDVVVAFLHGDMLMPAYVYRRSPAAIMVSTHRDGELITQVVHRLGQHRAVRGSSTRGGARAFLQMVHDLGDVPWSITPDGPRGPRGVVQEGAILLAAQSERPIVGAGFAVSWGKRFDSWDRFVIPGPFARVVCHFADPMYVPADIDREGRARHARELERRLQNAHEEAVRRLENW